MKHLLLMSVFSAFVLIVITSSTHAATFTVTKTADTNDGVCDADCSLREAVAAANAVISDDLIVFDPALFSTAQTIDVSLGQIQIFNFGSLTIRGPGAPLLTIGAGYRSRVFGISMSPPYTHTVTIEDVTVTTGETSGPGGCIYKESGVLTLRNVTIRNCNAGADGGAIQSSLGSLIVTGSAFLHNTTNGDGGAISGGGTDAVFHVSNSTLTDNSANVNGGAINSGFGTTATITNVTVVGNHAIGNGGGIYNTFNGTTTNLGNSIVANNTAFGSGPDFSGTLTSTGHNLVRSVSGTTISGDTTGNILGQDPLLGPFQDNGGPTSTMSPLNGSPALDAGSPASPLTTDQRGVTRPLDGNLDGTPRADIGAVEYGARVVTKVEDTDDGVCDADCSLREAITSANDSATDDVILLSTIFYTPKTIVLSGSQLRIVANGKLRVLGTGALIIDANNQSRLFSIDSGADLYLQGVTLRNGNGRGPNSDLSGGAIFNLGSLEIFAVRIVDCRASIGGGGLYNSAGTVSITDSFFEGNTVSTTGGGAIFNSGILHVASSVIRNNTTDEVGGGGINNLGGSVTIIASEISGNRAFSNGGGLLNRQNGTFEIADSTIESNWAQTSGGGINGSTGSIVLLRTTVKSNSTKFLVGGGIYSAGGLRIEESALIMNSSSSDGGAIFADSPGSLTLINSTLALNTAAVGGAIRYSSSAQSQIRNSTIAKNTASQSGGGIFNPLGDLAVFSSIIGDNVSSGLGPDCLGNIKSEGFNLIENTLGTTITGVMTGNLLGRDPHLGGLRNYGGPTPTLALLPISPAIDAGDPTNHPSTDQRGQLRPQDGNLDGSILPDIGAYERSVTIFTVTNPSDTGNGICDSNCTLREAVSAVNGASSPDNAIIFNASFSQPRTILLGSGELSITNGGTFLLRGRGPDLLTISGNNASRIFNVETNAQLTVEGVTVARGNGQGVGSPHGGAFRVFNGGTLYLVDSVVRDNHVSNSGRGGGIAVFDGSLFLLNTTIIENSTSGNAGGGISLQDSTAAVRDSVIQNNQAGGDGGGIAQSGGVLTVQKSSITGNAGHDAGGIKSSGTFSMAFSTVEGNSADDGAGGVYLINSDAAISTSTISGNSASFNGGGGIRAVGSTLSVGSTTIAFNDANADNDASGSGGGIRNSGSTISVRNSIIARNKGATGPDFDGQLTSQGFNLIQDISGATITGNTAGNILGRDPHLLPLGDNGGSTLTHGLRRISPALDSGNGGELSITDQRLFTRPYDLDFITNAPGSDGSDIGAFERQSTDVDPPTPFDFDGDGKADMGVFRPDGGQWWLLRSGVGNGDFTYRQFGLATDQLVPADYTGDGVADVAVFRETGEWYVLRSGLEWSYFGFHFGGAGDIAVPGDYDGDGKADAAVYRPSEGVFYIFQSSNLEVRGHVIGLPDDKPVTGDFDGDGKADPTLWRPSTGEWFILTSSNNNALAVVQFGAAGDKTVPADYTGDGVTDIAVWRPSEGVWYIIDSAIGGYFGFPFGLATDLPAPADYDGDGMADPTVFRPETGDWYSLRTTEGLSGGNWGIATDRPVAGAYVR